MNITALTKFIATATGATYVGGGKKEKIPERQGFSEMVYTEGDFHYRDSWTGYIRSGGMELIRYKGKPVWSSLYGGGMVEGRESLADDCFEFLKKAISSKGTDSQSVRGPLQFQAGIWRYTYKQEGDNQEFNGYEQIFHKQEPVFFHRVIGGLIKH